ncbi:hypothetical protein C1X61_03110 [Pseudomonas sp. FW215-T2]|nr:hypothetical protein C1X61_03110 [Pseudomonas sp. FW215-T2]PNA14900.1 hypothetical protein C1X62_05775 [Pseudomonas sp. FW215-R3]PNB39276.1 hypothetical protein C1X63_04260 [Pseudomonas sp. FW305-131]
MDRLLLFPEPLPDESLYSLAVRYHRLVANDSYRRTSQELFGTYSRTCGSVLPCCLGPLSQRLEGQYSIAELVETRTLLPLYKPFLSEEAYESALQCMQGTQGTGLKMSLGMTASGLLKHASFRYCDACLRHDADDYGVPYWHRIHMAAGVCTCPHHGNVLLSASFPGGSDWRCMLLPGESTGTLVLDDLSSEAVNAVAEMQFWGLMNPQRVCDLVRGGFLRWRLAEMRMLKRGRLMEQAIKTYVERRFRRCAQERDFQAVTKESEWVMRLLRRRGRVIQPFHFYFLCWLLESTMDHLRDFNHSDRSEEGSFISPTQHRCRPVSEAEIVKYRLAYMDDPNEKCHDKTGYFWLYRHDKEWLRKNTKHNCIGRRIKSRIDWSARDVTLSHELVAARDELMATEGKPIKITKSAIVSKLSNDYNFLRNVSRFPESSKALESLLETEHDYQLRKVSWAIKQLSFPQCCYTSLILRLAGIRIRRISEFEISRLVRIS